MPRKPIGNKPMTQAQRQARKRDRERQSIDALASALLNCIALIHEDHGPMSAKAIADAKAILKIVGRWPFAD